MDLVDCPSAAHRHELATHWLARRSASDKLLIVAAQSEVATRAAQSALAGRSASFGWQRTTLDALAVRLALDPLCRSDVAPIGQLPLQALCARTLQRLRGSGRSLGCFEAVAERPGLPRAIAQTLSELAMANLTPADLDEHCPDLARIYECYLQQLTETRLADRASVLRLATEAVQAHPRQAGDLVGVPLLLLDVPATTPLQGDLIGSLARRAPDVFATVPSGDRRSRRQLERALGRAAAVHDHRSLWDGALSRLQCHLFQPDARQGELGSDVMVLSAPGESRECVEIARQILEEARRGVAFDRMAVLLRAPASYQAHLVEALSRAHIPYHMSHGAVRPDPSGRALLSLLRCRAEGLSARAFAEYLSLGMVPDAVDGCPPPPVSAEQRWVPPNEALLQTAQREADLEPAEETRLLEQTDPEQPVNAGSLRAPRRWERLLVEAAVSGGIERWQRRLAGLARGLGLEREAAQEEGLSTTAIDRRLDELQSLRAYALPLLRELDALPQRATWGQWIDSLSALATRALREPERVLAVLAELNPMADLGPVSLTEVRLTLEHWLTDLRVRPTERAEGRVFVGDTDSSRGLVFDVVFVPGLAEKIFPGKIGEDPVLRDSLRAKLSPELAVRADRIDNERLHLRLAVGAATQRVVLTYPRVDLDRSRPRVPSFYGLEILRAAEGVLPGFDQLMKRAESTVTSRLGWPAPDDPLKAIDEAEHDLAVLEGLLGAPEEATRGAAHYLLNANAHLARALRFRANRWSTRKWTKADGLVQPSPEAMRALERHFLTARTYSATALEQFAACPYRFFLGAIVGLQPREELQAIERMDARERGSLIHDAQFELLGRLRREGLLPVTDANIEAVLPLLDEALQKVSARYEEELAPAIDRVWQDGLAEVRTDLRQWLRRMPRNAGWVPRHFELGFGLSGPDERDPSSRPDPVALDCGMTLRGCIDLVEQHGAELRATDHKTGRAQSEPRARIGGGRTLQPILYALALEQLFPDERVRSGRLYYCTARGNFEEHEIPLDEAARNAARHVAETIGEALTSGFLPAAPARDECARCDYRPVCGPYEEMRSARKAQQVLVPLRRLREEL